MLRKVVEYRELAKANGSWLEPLLKLSEFDGSFHSELHPFGTVSFRMSSKDLNAQGIPMGEHDKRAGGSMLGVFKSKLPGQELWAIDLKQAEVRLAAILSGDQQLQQQLATGDDPYVALATSIWGDPTKRSDAKRAMLSSIYEVGPHTFSERYGGTEAEARAVLDAFRNRYPQTRRHSKTVANFVDRHRFVELITGRPRFYFDEPSYSAYNQEVQGSLAEICHEWMLRYEQAFPGQLILQVHDSLVAYMPEEEVARNAEVAAAGRMVQEAALEMIPGYARHHMIDLPIEAKPWQLL
jgi:DNA polymerase-1